MNYVVGLSCLCYSDPFVGQLSLKGASEDIILKLKGQENMCNCV